MSHKHTDILIALTGQPNTGKSTVFSMLTGVHQHIGNYPGVTVEKKSGHFHEGKHRIEVVDLPGTYSLTSYTQEERVTRDFILLERPELLIAVVDASNVRRHLYLIYQLLEMQIPLLICLNMMDMAVHRGLKVDVDQLSRELGVPVIPTVGKKDEGTEELRKAILETIATEAVHDSTAWAMNYGEQLETALAPLVESLAAREHLVEDFSPRWLAVKLMEQDREARRIVQHHTHDEKWAEILEQADKILAEYEKNHAETPLKVISHARDRSAEEVEHRCVTRVKPVKSFSDKIDKITCHPVLGLICAILMMVFAFQVSFNLSGTWTWIPCLDGEWRSPVGICEFLFEEWAPKRLDAAIKLDDGPLRSLVFDGVIAGVGGVIVFVPVIFFIFLAISCLEQCGYVARLGLVMHRLMKRFGLHGNSVLPMILGGGIAGGCAIPAIMATRTMREPKERLLTILVIPFMNCGAKLPVYGVLTAAFFTHYQGMVFASLVLISWTVALLAAAFLSRMIVKGEPTPLLIELPSYQVPTFRVVVTTAIQQSWWFVKKAGTFILAVAVVLWALMYFPQMESTPENPIGKSEQLEYSIAGRCGRALEPIGRFAGFDWRDNIALLGGFAAKEVILSTLATLYSIDAGEENAPEGEEYVSEEDSIADRLRERMQNDERHSPLGAFAMMVFVMLYAPCLPSCATIWRETRSLRWMLTSMAFSTTIAFVIAVAIYQIGRLFLP